MQRPTSVTVFGVLNLVFSVWGLGALAFAAFFLLTDLFPTPEGLQPTGLASAYQVFSFVWGFGGSVVLAVCGVGLLLMRPWARVLAIAYAVFTIVMTIVNTTATYFLITRPMIEHFRDEGVPEMAGAVGGVFGGMIGGCFALIYPILLWYFMSRPRVVSAFFGTVPSEVHDSFARSMPVEPSHVAGAANPYTAPQVDTATAAPVAAGESIVETFVPSKNAPALAAYYLGLFSLFPCLGFPLGVGAVYLGIKGLRRVKANPAVRGGAHAWVGVICGSLFGLFNFLLIVLLAVAGIAAALDR